MVPIDMVKFDAGAFADFYLEQMEEAGSSEIPAGSAPAALLGVIRDCNDSGNQHFAALLALATWIGSMDCAGCLSGAVLALLCNPEARPLVEAFCKRSIRSRMDRN